MPAALAQPRRPTARRVDVAETCRAWSPTAAARAGAREPGRERARVVAAGHAAASTGGRRRRRGRPADRRPRPGHPAAPNATGSSSRSSASATRRSAGVGLGLAVAQGFVEAMGGELRSRTRPAAGSRSSLGCEAADVTPRPRRRRRAADPARARAPTCARGATTSTCAGDRREGARRSRPRTTPTSSSSTSACPASTGSTSSAGLRGWTGVPIVVLSVRDARARQGRGARRRRRRLRHEAVRDGRAARAAAGRAPPGAPAEDEAAVVDDARLHRRPRAKRVTTPRRARCSSRRPSGTWSRCSSATPGKLVTPAPAPAGGLGAAVRDRDELPPRLHGPDPPQARARPVAAPLLHHRAADGLPLQARGSLSQASPVLDWRRSSPCGPATDGRHQAKEELRRSVSRRYRPHSRGPEGARASKVVQRPLPSQPLRGRQDPARRRRSRVKSGPSGACSRYDEGVRDLVFVSLTLGFFAAAVAFVAGCERVVGRSAVGVERER